MTDHSVHKSTSMCAAHKKGNVAAQDLTTPFVIGVTATSLIAVSQSLLVGYLAL